MTQGFGVRPSNWQASVSMQHEILSRITVTVGYFRRWYGDLLAQQNVAVSASDFTPYCVTAPVDQRLPDGGGYQVCGLYDVNPSAFGRVQNVITQASRFGENTEVFDGVDVTASRRFGRGGLLQGGVSTGRTVTDHCFVSDKPDLSAGLVGGASITPTYGAALKRPYCLDIAAPCCRGRRKRKSRAPSSTRCRGICKLPRRFRTCRASQTPQASSRLTLRLLHRSGEICPRVPSLGRVTPALSYRICWYLTRNSKNDLTRSMCQVHKDRSTRASPAARHVRHLQPI